MHGSVVVSLDEDDIFEASAGAHEGDELESIDRTSSLYNPDGSLGDTGIEAKLTSNFAHGITECCPADRTAHLASSL